MFVIFINFLLSMPTFITLYDGMKYAVRILFDAKYIQAKTENVQPLSLEEYQIIISNERTTFY